MTNKIMPTTEVDVQNLVKYFDVSAPWLSRVFSGQPKQILKAVDGISFKIQKGETFSLVGESGCGKSTIARLLVGLYEPTDGKIKIKGHDISNLDSPKALRTLRKNVQMIFQDPFASLNPRWHVKDIIAEPIRAHKTLSDNHTIDKRVNELLDLVSLTKVDGDKFPHEFSGGQRQRISIARALASKPEFIVCDEPTSALDVSVQAQILNLMVDLQKELGLTYLFISHNLAVVYHISDHVGVMYLGRLAEVRDSKSLFSNPLHPYTRLLLDTIPDLDMSGRDRMPVAGEVPNPIDPPSACRFHPRCPFANERCKTEMPLPTPVPGGYVECHGVQENRLPAYVPIVR
ncbi:MAG: ATP-binding cassette domain-containing protein [Alphaproteobacteria bacterium]|nr:ATP-binding cassette domain-containing protein [Alphaproteobacteria bacterium]